MRPSSSSWLCHSPRLLSSDPIGKFDSAKPSLSRRYKRCFLDLTAEVRGPRISLDGSPVTHHAQIVFDDFIEGRPVRSGDFNRTVARSCYRRVRHEGCHVIGGDWLKQAGGDADDAVLLAGIGNASEEL